MSKLSIALKNSVLIALLIMIIHVIARNHLHDRAMDAPRYAAPLQHRHQHQQPPLQPPSVVGVVETLLEPPAAAKNASAPVVEPAAAAMDQQRLLEEYVFGASEPPAAPKKPPAPGAADAKPAAMGGKADSGNNKVAVDTFAQPTDMSNNMVVGSYDNESTMCGGKLFDGGLTGFDGMQAMYQKL